MARTSRPSRRSFQDTAHQLSGCLCLIGGRFQHTRSFSSTLRCKFLYQFEQARPPYTDCTQSTCCVFEEHFRQRQWLALLIQPQSVRRRGGDDTPRATAMEAQRAHCARHDWVLRCGRSGTSGNPQTTAHPNHDQRMPASGAMHEDCFCPKGSRGTSRAQSTSHIR